MHARFTDHLIRVVRGGSARNEQPGQFDVARSGAGRISEFIAAIGGWREPLPIKLAAAPRREALLSVAGCNEPASDRPSRSSPAAPA